MQTLFILVRSLLVSMFNSQAAHLRVSLSFKSFTITDTLTHWDLSPFVFESLKNQEIPHSCSYKGCLTLFKSLDKEYMNSLSDLKEMLQIEALKGF